MSDQRIHFFLTTFPVLSETFVQRELRALRAGGMEPVLHSLWGGDKEWEGVPVRRFPRWRYALALFFFWPWWWLRRPRAITRLVRRVFGQRHGWLNVLENMAGCGFALVMADRLRREGVDHVHAVWATVPGAAALTLHELNGTNYTLEGHAFDLFAHGGDALLPAKVAAARAVRTSSEYAGKSLRIRFPHATVEVIPRSLAAPAVLPRPAPPAVTASRPLHLLAIGRLVPKKGYPDLLGLAAAWQQEGLDFSLRIVGDGPLRARLERMATDEGLGGQVDFLGARSPREVEAQLTWADALLFTGQVATNGDRDGVPNVLLEAMAVGVPILSTKVAGVDEAVRPGETGWLLPRDRPELWGTVLRQIAAGDPVVAAMTARAHDHLRTRFDPATNAAALRRFYAASHPGADP